MVEYQLGIECRCACCNRGMVSGVSQHTGTWAECEDKILSLLAAIDSVRKRGGDLCCECAAKAASNAC